MRVEHSAGFVIFREIKGQIHYLILHYISGHYDFPKGHLEPGESNLDAAIRELLEETGITEIELIPNFSQQIDYYFHREGQPTHKFVTFFLAKDKSTIDIKISREHIGFKWVPFQEAMTHVTFENARALLSKADQYLKKL